MTTPTKTRTRRVGRALFDAIWQAPLWAVPFALFFALLFGARDWHDFTQFYLVSLTFALVIRLCLWVAECFIVPRAAAAYGHGGHPPLPIGIGIYGSASVLGSYIAGAIVHFTLYPGFLGTPRSILLNGVFALLFTVLTGGIIYATVFYRLAVERARAVEQARAELAQAELRALRAQMNPHFLFNALNTIAALVRDDPDGAEDTTTRLAELFRYTLRASERERAPLGDELAFVRDYLAIEHRRFGARLTVREDVAPGLSGLAVPTLLLQPLVENAVRHGVAPRAEGGTVTLAARRDGETLVIEVGDDGPGFASEPSPSGNGFGLHSVRERLRALGPPHALDIESGHGHGTTVRLTVPVTLLPTPVANRHTTPESGNA